MQGPSLGIQISSDKICSDSESLKGGSQCLNLDKSYKSSDTEVPQYPNRGGSLSIQTSLDKKFSDSISPKTGLGI